MTQNAKDRQFRALVDLHGAAVMALLRRLCGNLHDAEELFQETALRVWQSPQEWPKLRNPRSWLMTIAYRVYLNRIARRRSSEPLGELADRQALTPEAVAVQSETAAEVQVAIDGLAEPLREVVLLHYVGHLTLKETAAAMNLSPGTVKSRLNAALGKLRSVLE